MIEFRTILRKILNNGTKLYVISKLSTFRRRLYYWCSIVSIAMLYSLKVLLLSPFPHVLSSIHGQNFSSRFARGETLSVLPLRTCGNGDNSKTLRLHSLQWTQWSISNKNAFSVLNFDITTSYCSWLTLFLLPGKNRVKQESALKANILRFWTKTV